MSISLRDQLVKAGLATEEQARKTGKQQRRHKGSGKARDEAKQRAEREAQAARRKAERDRELNEKRQAEAERRARRAEVHQIVEQHALPVPDTEERFNFVDRGRVRRVPVDGELRRRIVAGELAVVRDGRRYALVPLAIAERVRERDPAVVVDLGGGETDQPDENDPYRDYVVPDDLVW